MRAILFATLLLTACSENSDGFTLYRNSQVDPGMPIFFASFDAPETDPSYNMNNCQMVARALNANVAALAEKEGRQAPTGLGFWCEPGAYREKGLVPFNFDAEYPTSV